MKTKVLHSNWTVRRSNPMASYLRTQVHDIPTLRATVPGHIHLDLIANGIIGDPFQEKLEAGCRWVDECSWTYESEFEWNPDPELPLRTLVFEGLDTICRIYLNDELLGESNNFHLPVEFDVTERLLEGLNQLKVVFASPVEEGDKRRTAYFSAHGIPNTTMNFDERAFVRKPGYMSGWDWGPRLVSCGIWRPVRLLEYRGRLTECSVLQRPLDGNRFLLEAVCSQIGEGDLSLFYNGRPVSNGDKAIEVADEKWWPHGEGEQVLQSFEFRLSTGDSVTRKVGLRTIELVRAPDDIGRSFEFVVNGRRAWSRGANWIPNDSFPSRITDESLHQSVERYATLGMNMLRVWGGGMYESEAFYDACDRVGMMVWQDFPYACSYYPDDAQAQEVADKEARFHVKRLRDRTSLAIWCGNNENRSMWHGKWGGLQNSPDRFYGEPIFDEVLPKVVQELDPGRPYIESSPLLVKGVEGAPDDPPAYSDDHYWDAWHGRGDWKFYSDSMTRFSSEFGFASSCSMEVWRTVSERPLALNDPTVLWHDKTNKGWETFKGYVSLHYPESATLEDWIYYSQLNQRDAMRAAIEHYRSGDRCRGALIWQANDCWPVQSWALEDYSRLMKTAGFELMRLYAALLLVPKIEGTNVSAILANDGAETIDDMVIMGVVSMSSGNVLERHEFEVRALPTERVQTPLVSVQAFDPKDVVLRFGLKSGISRDRWVFLAEPKDLNLNAGTIEASFGPDRLELHCPGFVGDLVVWDDACPHCLSDKETELSGFAANSGVDLRLSFGVHGDVVRLKARSLAGFHEIRIVKRATAT